MSFDTAAARRRFLSRSALFAGAGALPALSAQAAVGTGTREVSMAHTHTGEHIAIAYAVGASYLPAALDSLNHFLRDHYSGDVAAIDPQLFDQLHRLRLMLGSARAFEIISGYRSPATNEHLRRTRGGGVAPHSLHTEGRAVDVRLPGTALADLRDAALALGAGGVGYYPRDAFVHLDSGRPRRW